MKAFMDKDFMLQSATAQQLYHDYAAAMPICPARSTRTVALRTSLRCGWAAVTRTAATSAIIISGA